jgi:hypothetical protein
MELLFGNSAYPTVLHVLRLRLKSLACKRWIYTGQSRKLSNLVHPYQELEGYRCMIGPDIQVNRRSMDFELYTEKTGMQAMVT